MNYILIVLVILILACCATVPNSIRDVKLDGSQKGKIFLAEQEKFDGLSTPIGKIYKDILKKNPELSGASLINDGEEAFLARAAFARMATKTIELQTYIYNNDHTSRILLQELQEAANRGVQVKILVDDNGMDSDLSDIMILDLHENIEVKVFNTFKFRSRILRYPQFLFDFNRLNSRMHNKLFIVDNVAVIVGGRNIAENYFDSHKETNFSDTDVVFLGKIAREARTNFYDYWNYHLSIPAYLFPTKKEKNKLIKLREEFLALQEKRLKKAEAYETVINYIVSMYKSKKTHFDWGKGAIVADSPSKIDITQNEKFTTQSPLVKAIGDLFGSTKKSIYISAAYFVPGDDGNKMFIEAENRGVDVNIVTNSLSSTDSTVVYSAWERYRNELLEHNINIYEFMNERLKKKGKDKKISSFASLHSKTIVFDEKLSWIGSFNLDPRSALLNTEIVAVFESEVFAKKLVAMVKNEIKSSWKLESSDGKTVWIDKNDKFAGKDIMNRAPNTSLWKRFKSVIMKIVPEKLI